MNSPYHVLKSFGLSPDVAFNIILVGLGVRPATLIQFEDINEKAMKSLKIYLNGMKKMYSYIPYYHGLLIYNTEQFNEGNMKQFKRCIDSGEINDITLGKILGFMCPMDLSKIDKGSDYTFTFSFFIVDGEETRCFYTERCDRDIESKYDSYGKAFQAIAKSMGLEVQFNKIKEPTESKIEKLIATGDIKDIRWDVSNYFANRNMMLNEDELKNIKLLKVLLPFAKCDSIMLLRPFNEEQMRKLGTDIFEKNNRQIIDMVKLVLNS